MNNLNQKIKNTALFTSDEKIEILAAFDTFSQSDKVQLEDIVDEYDRKFSQIISTFKQHMIDELDMMGKSTDKVQMQEAIEKIKSGLNSIIDNTPA